MATRFYVRLVLFLVMHPKDAGEIAYSVDSYLHTPDGRNVENYYGVSLSCLYVYCVTYSSCILSTLNIKCIATERY